MPFTAANYFCREVSRSYGAKEAFSLKSSLCRNLTCFLFLISHSSTYISHDVRWCDPHKQVYFFDIGWPQTSGDNSTCVVQFRVQFGSMWRSRPNWACVFSRGVGKRQSRCYNSSCFTTSIFVLCMCFL